MIASALKKNDIVLLKKSNRPTIAFRGVCFLIALLLWSFYRDALFTDQSTNRIVVLFFVMYFPKIVCIIYLGMQLVWKFSNKPLNKSFILLCVFSLTIAISYLVTKSGITKILDLLLVALCLMFFNNFALRKNEIKKVICLLIIATVIILFNASPIKGYTFESDKFNPNEAAYCLTLLFCVLITAFVKYKKIAYLLAALVCVGLQFVYGSRTAFFGLLLFCILCVLLRARKKTFGFYTVFIAIIALAVCGVVFTHVYSVVLFEKYGKNFVSILGKDLFTGRERIWQLALESIRNNFWFGVGSHLNEEYFTEGSVIMNAHNQPLGILGAFGVLALISFYLLLAYVVAKQCKHRNRVLAIFFIVVVLMSYLDLHLFQSKNYSMMLLTYAVISALSTFRRYEKRI